MGSFDFPESVLLADSGWQALQSADWAWLPAVIAASALTYLAGAAALIGSVPVRLPVWPTVLTQAASSFINRVSPANIGGMALNVRFLQKSGIPPAAGVAAVGAAVSAVLTYRLSTYWLPVLPGWACLRMLQRRDRPAAPAGPRNVRAAPGRAKRSGQKSASHA